MVRDFPGIFINYESTAMSKLDEIEMARQQAGGIVQQFICTAPKNDHEGMNGISSDNIYKK